MRQPGVVHRPGTVRRPGVARPRSREPLAGAVVLAGLGLLAPAARGQIGPLEARPEGGRAVAIQGCRIVTGTGTTFESGTILIREDRIEAVGSGIEVPFDAVPFDARGLVAYPGFLDALLVQESVPAEGRDEEGPAADLTRGALAAFAEANRKGLRADRRAASLLDLSEETQDELRRAGFTAAWVTPPRNLLAGTGAVTSLSGRPRRDAVIAADTAMLCDLDTGGGGAYPATRLGRLALLRQTVLDARRREAILARNRRLAANDPAPIPARVPTDPQLEALLPVLHGSIPLVVEAESETRIRRALALAGEFAVQGIVAGGREAARATRALREANVPVVLAIDFPKEPELPGEGAPETPPEAGGEGGAPKAPGARERPAGRAGAAARPRALEDPPAMIPRRVLERAHEEWIERVTTPQALDQDGIPFALTAEGAPPAKFLEHLRTAIEHGLSEEIAVEALTRGAARILGVEATLGTLERGRAAHVTLLDGPLGAKKSRVRAVFSDGVRFDFRDDEPAPPARGLDLTGTWDFTAAFPAQRFEARLHLEMQPSGEIEGTLEGETFTGTVKGRVSRTHVTFSIRHEQEGKEVTWASRGEVAAGSDLLEGTIHTPQGRVSWTARRGPREGDER